MLPNFFNLGTGEIIIIVFVLLLLFGGRKIPELMRGLGKGIRSFKQGMNDITDEINSPDVIDTNPPKPRPKSDKEA
ncbi:MAG: twin-arginine translocase TatA/TatE family subunit [Bacteroidales bacterium]|nr:twin-arginine translocase TatA/TatE family subunit [Bacteroidales bacterium]